VSLRLRGQLASQGPDLLLESRVLVLERQFIFFSADIRWRWKIFPEVDFTRNFCGEKIKKILAICPWVNMLWRLNGEKNGFLFLSPSISGSTQLDIGT
jgi:hypothetical protein